MNDYEESLKKKHWKDFKTAVGTMVSQSKSGTGRLTLDELYLNIKTASFSSLVCQTEIQTEADKQALCAKGYDIPVTADELQSKLQLNPARVWYSPSISNRCLYFNEETLAAAPLHIDLMLAGIYPGGTDSFYKALEQREADVAANQYADSISFLPDAMQMEYFNLLVEKKGSAVPYLYELFFSTYINSDYGFTGLKPSTLKTILNAKTEADREKTRSELEKLPDPVKIYRGGNSASTPYSEAYSWSLDINVANFFACRRGTGNGYIVEGEVAKKDIIEAFLEDRNEQEIFVSPDNIKILKEISVQGLDFLEPVLPEVAPMYREFKDQLTKLQFAQNSDEHGPDHEARVMLLSLILADQLDLPLRDRRVLATAAIYHDTQRVNDTDDSVHGKAGSEYYHANNSNPDPLVEFLCEYHCRPDEEGYKEILNNRKLSKSRSRSKLLLDIFKDADGLERVRFGIQALDVNQLRLPISKELGLVARLLTEQVKDISLVTQPRPSLSSQIQSASVRTPSSTPVLKSRSKGSGFEH